MEKLLMEFINTFDLSLKKLQQEAGEAPGFSKLTLNQFRYIDAISQLDDPTITEIAEKLAITKASVTPGINKLVTLGFATKTQSTIDKRVFHVSLTDISRRMVSYKYKALIEYGEFIQSALTEEEARQFERTIAKLVRFFDQNK